MKKINTRRVAAAVGVAGAALMGLTSLGAGGAAAGPLPGASATKTLADGTPVTIRLYDESVNIQRAVTNVQTSREAWLSGKIKVNVGGKAEGASIQSGYIFGCQVNFGASAGGGAGTEAAPDPTNGATVTPSASSNAGVTLGPGQAKTVWLIDSTSSNISNTADSNYSISDYTFTGNSGGVAYSQEKVGVDGCAGYASAQAIIQVKVSTDSVKGIVTLRGKPFSLG